MPGNPQVIDVCQPAGLRKMRSDRGNGGYLSLIPNPLYAERPELIDPANRVIIGALDQ